MNQSVPCCPVCISRTKAAHLEVDGGIYYRCKRCEAVFVWPIKERKYYAETETYLSNPKSYVDSIDLLGQRWIIEQFERLYSNTMQTEQKGTYLEIGSGVGFLVLFATARGWRAKGLELSREAAAFGRDFLRVDIEVSNIEDHRATETYDAIAMVEVLEHFTDPLTALKHIRRHAKDKTFIFGTTPNTASGHWITSKQNIYVPDDHICLFNEKTLNVFAKNSNIRNFKVETFGSGENHDSNLMYSGYITSS